jgi:hypothetical protein
MILKKGKKLYSILFGYCPRCHNEFMYQTKNPYFIFSTLKMKKDCNHCKLIYKMEPSFFYGSMYVSYGVGIGFALIAFLLSILLFGFNLIYAFGFISISQILLLPIILRLSRNIWINIFVRYDSKYSINKSA